MTFFPASCAFALPTDTMKARPINGASALYGSAAAAVAASSSQRVAMKVVVILAP